MPHRKNKKFISVLSIALVLVLLAVVFLISIKSAKKTLENKVNTVPELELKEEETTSDESVTTQQTEAESSVKWQDGWVKYEGEIYQYKEDILTFLLMGTDQNGSGTGKAGNLNGGQADVQTLLVLDPNTKRIELISINRNTMAEIDVYDAVGNVIDTVKGQIAVQHGVGDGGAKSCEYQVKAVSRLFYQLPIHGYIAMNLAGIVPLGEAVGGVNVTLPNDFNMGNRTYKAGETIFVEGKDVMLFVRERDHEVGGADRRLERQKVYMKALTSQMISKIKANPTYVTTLYQAISKYITTDITASEMLYLATEAASYRYDGKSMHSIEGETVKGEEFDEFYADEAALKKLIIDIFYEKVEN